MISCNIMLHYMTFIVEATWSPGARRRGTSGVGSLAAAELLFVYIHMYTCVHVYMYTCMYISLSLSLYIYIYICI